MKNKAPANLKMYSMFRNMEHENLKNPGKKKINPIRIDGESKDNESIRIISKSPNSKPNLATSEQAISPNN